MNEYKDLIVKSENPAELDRIVQNFNAVVLQDGNGEYVARASMYYTVRCFGNWDFVRFAINQQGYGEVVDTIPDQLPWSYVIPKSNTVIGVDLGMLPGSETNMVVARITPSQDTGHGVFSVVWSDTVKTDVQTVKAIAQAWSDKLGGAPVITDVPGFVLQGWISSPVRGHEHKTRLHELADRLGLSPDDKCRIIVALAHEYLMKKEKP